MPKERKDSEASPGSFWSGTITFGLVSVPVELFPANKSSHLRLRTLAPDGTPLRRQYVSSQTGRELSPQALARGYDTGGGNYVLVSDDELEKLAPEKSRDIDLRMFVEVSQVHPIYFERGYFLAPAGDSDKAYRLLAKVLESTRRAGIATFVMRGKEYLICIVSENGILRAETMRFKDEIRTPADVGLPEKVDVATEAKHRFEKMISQHAANGLPQAELHDESSEALLKLVKSKQAHKQDLIVRPEAAAEEDNDEAAPDLFAALKRSLTSRHGRGVKNRPTARPRPRPHHQARPRRAGRVRRVA